MADDKLSKKTADATRWSTITELIAKLISPITNMLLARLLTPEAFGVIATINMVISFADMFTDAGFQKYLIQHKFIDKEELDNNTNVAFWSNLVISIFLWFIISLFSEQIASIVGNNGLGIVVSVAAISLPLTSFSSIQMARFKRSFDFKNLFYIRIVSAVVPLVVTVPLALFTRNYWALVIGTIAGNLINAILLTIRSEWKPSLYFNLSVLKNMFSYSGWILLESITVWFTSYADTFIVGAYLSNYFLGLYKTSMTTTNQVIGLVTAATSAPLFTALSKLQTEEDYFKNFYYKYIQAISVFLVPLGVGMFIYSDLVTTILLGSQWLEASSFIGLWSLTSSFCIVFGTYCSSIYNAKGKPLFSVIVQLLHLIAMIPVLLISVEYSFEFLCIARSLVRFQFIIVQLFMIKKYFKFSISHLIKVTIPSFMCTIVMALFAYLFLSISQLILWQFVSVFICIIIYFITMRIIYNDLVITSFRTLGFDITVVLGSIKRRIAHEK